MSANRADLTRVIREVTDAWDEPLDEVHDVPQIVNAVLAYLALSSDAAPQDTHAGHRWSRALCPACEEAEDAAPQEVAQVRYADGEWSREYVEDDADPQEDGPDLAPLLAAAAAARAWRKRQSTREAVDRAVSGLRYEHYDEQDTHLGTCLLVSDLPVFLAALGIPVADAPAAPEGERS